MTNNSNNNSNKEDLGKELDDLITRIRKRVAYHILAEDLPKVLDAMWNEKEITSDNTNHIQNIMIGLAKGRGYI